MTFLEKTKRFLEPLLQDKKYLILSCIKFTLWAFYSILIIILIKNTTNAIITDDIESFESITQIFTFCIILYFIINYIGRKWEWPILYYKTEKYISDTYVRKMMMIDNNYIEALWSGKLVSIMQNGIKRWNEHLAFLLRDFTRTAVVFVATIYILYSMDNMYGGVFIICIFIVHALVVWIDSFARSFRKIRTEKRHEYARKLVQIIMSKIEILQNNQMNTRARELYKIHEDIEEADEKVAHSLFFIFNVPRIFLAFARIGILYSIGYKTFTGEFTITDFTLAMTILLMFETFLLDSIEFYKNFTKEFSTIESMWDAIDNWPEIQWYDSWLSFQPKKEDIEISSISYGYNEAKVFDNFSLIIKRWQKTALVGASGWWKTTLMKLIAWYLHPESGSISVLGNRLNETALKTYYPHIGYLTQDPWVFDATIRENLVSAISNVSVIAESESVSVTNNEAIQVSEKQNMDHFVPRDDRNENEIEEQLIQALRLAHCDFVFDLEKWLDTEIGERGVRLSWGQKQRLAIAKIFLKNPEIILLDEPTSALDSFSEEAITIALDELFRDRTVIIVAHRLQTVKKSDEIIVLEWWKVVERGNHNELVEQRWIYNRMLELQSGF